MNKITLEFTLEQISELQEILAESTAYKAADELAKCIESQMIPGYLGNWLRDTTVPNGQ